jgi:HSP20 family molecular chaperone IbpA
MDSQDEKYFESLASGKTGADDGYEVELAKADSAVMARAKVARPRAEAEKDRDDGEPEGQLTVDVYQTPTEIVVESAIAGVKPDDIDINVTPDSIVIRGSRRREKQAEQEDYLYQECYWGRFARSIILPQEVDPEGAEVMFKNGILTVHLPKANKKRSKKLRVRTD